MNLVPMNDRLIIKQAEKLKESAGGVILPDTVGEDHTEGIILSMGMDYKATDLRVGDRIIFTKWSGVEVKIDGETFVIIKEKDILAWYDEPRQR